MLQRSIGIAVLPLLFLACSCDSDSKDAARDASNQVLLVPSPYDLSPPPDVPTCVCQTFSKTLNGPEVVACETAESFCNECPVPFQGRPPCTTIDLHCKYPGQWCDCQIGNDGTLVWGCKAWVE